MLQLFFLKVVAQSISPPSYGADGLLLKYCSNKGVVEYKSTFSFSGFSASNQFTLELSDDKGSFTTPTTLVGPTSFGSSPATFSFYLPSTCNGEGYKLRIKSTLPALSVVSNNPGKPMYYMPYNSNFYINSKATDLLICGSGSIVLSIDASTPQDLSPLSDTTLKYKWYKDGVLIPGATATTYTVNNAIGTYYVAVDYGSCSTISTIAKSQSVNVQVITSGATFTLNSSLGTTICPANPTTLSTVPGYTYKWFRNDAEISGITTNSYTTSVPGNYKVLIEQGSCSSTTNTLTINTEDFDLSIDALLQPQINILPIGDSKIITATTTAISPTFEWIDASNNTIAATQTFTTSTPGDYKLKIKQNSGCIFTKELAFKIKNGILVNQIPNTISPNGDTINDYWAIPQEYLNQETEIQILDSFGKEVLKTTNYQNDWPSTNIEFESINPIFYYSISKNGGNIKNGSITIIK